jgi:hypothetical protein
MKSRIILFFILTIVIDLLSSDIRNFIGFNGGYIQSQTFLIGIDTLGYKRYKTINDIIQIGMFYDLNLPFNTCIIFSGELYKKNIFNNKIHKDPIENPIQGYPGFSLNIESYSNRFAFDVSLLYQILNLDIIRIGIGPGMGFANISESYSCIYREDNTKTDKDYNYSFWGIGPFFKLSSYIRATYYDCKIGMRLGIDYIYSKIITNKFDESKNEMPIHVYSVGISNCNENRIVWKCALDYQL